MLKIQFDLIFGQTSMELTFNFSKKISILHVSLIVALNNNQGVLIFFTHQTVSGHE